MESEFFCEIAKLLSNTRAVDRKPSHSEPLENSRGSGVRDQVDFFQKALDQRWKEIDGEKTPAEVGEQAHRRLLSKLPTHTLDNDIDPVSSNPVSSNN